MPGQAEKAGVFARFAGQRLADLDAIQEYLTEQVGGLVTVTRTDAVYAAVRMAADILRGEYVRGKKSERKQRKRRVRVREASDGSTVAGGSPDPWPPGTISLPGGADGAPRIESDAAPER